MSVEPQLFFSGVNNCLAPSFFRKYLIITVVEIPGLLCNTEENANIFLDYLECSPNANSRESFSYVTSML